MKDDGLVRLMDTLFGLGIERAAMSVMLGSCPQPKACEICAREAPELIEQSKMFACSDRPTNQTPHRPNIRFLRPDDAMKCKSEFTLQSVQVVPLDMVEEDCDERRLVAEILSLGRRGYGGKMRFLELRRLLHGKPMAPLCSLTGTRWKDEAR